MEWPFGALTRASGRRYTARMAPEDEADRKRGWRRWVVAIAVVLMVLAYGTRAIHGKRNVPLGPPKSYTHRP
ncbi:MAG TPA: hypothetical protein VF103_07540 [Polyangiaceae bacterium]